jgi:hypothetical protein
MTRLWIPFVERDIDDPPGRAAAVAALAASRLPTDLHTLPVVDVRGTVFLGFYPCLLEQAWATP